MGKEKWESPQFGLLKHPKPPSLGPQLYFFLLHQPRAIAISLDH